MASLDPMAPCSNGQQSNTVILHRSSLHQLFRILPVAEGKQFAMSAAFLSFRCCCCCYCPSILPADTPKLAARKTRAEMEGMTEDEQVGPVSQIKRKTLVHD
jgi:histone acetyltransferase (RNA polymerase elongator complex component)